MFFGAARCLKTLQNIKECESSCLTRLPSPDCPGAAPRATTQVPKVPCEVGNEGPSQPVRPLGPCSFVSLVAVSVIISLQPHPPPRRSHLADAVESCVAPQTGNTSLLTAGVSRVCLRTGQGR